MVGLTGGIGAGKSVVANRLVERGAVLIDSDRLAREVVAPGTEGLREVVAAFGDGVLDADGALDRPALGAVIFGDDVARARLEAIVHPRVRARSAELAAAAPVDAVVVHDVPLLVEVGLAPTYHLLVVVEADRERRIDRLTAHRGMSRDQAEQRIRAQVGDAERRAAADVLLSNDGELAGLLSRVDALWRDRLRPYEENLRGGTVAAPVVAGALAAAPTWPTAPDRVAARLWHALTRVDLPVVELAPATGPVEAAVEGRLDLRLTLGSPDDADRVAAPLAAAGFPRHSDGHAPGERAVGDPSVGGEYGSADPALPARLSVRVVAD